MKYLIAAAAILGAVMIAGPASAQSYGYGPVYTSPIPPAGMMYPGQAAPMMMDNGTSSDYPTHTPSDFVADQLNRNELRSPPFIILPPRW